MELKNAEYWGWQAGGSPGTDCEEEEGDVDCDDREDREEDVEEPQSTELLLLSAVVASWFIQPRRQTGIWAGPVWAGSSLSVNNI